jgi:hypothetical protein
MRSVAVAVGAAELTARLLVGVRVNLRAGLRAPVAQRTRGLSHISPIGVATGTVGVLPANNTPNALAEADPPEDLATDVMVLRPVRAGSRTRRHGKAPQRPEPTDTHCTWHQSRRMYIT